MARDGVEYEEVAAVASRLRAGGVKPTNRLVRTETGGSDSTVHRHLKRWNAENPEAATPPPELPAHVQRALQEELRRMQSEAVAALAERLATAQQNADDLSRECEDLKGDKKGLEQKLTELTAERDQLRGQTAQQTRDLESLHKELQEARGAAEAARVDLAQARLKAESQKELADSLLNERDRLRQLNDEERAGRVESERALAGANASLQALRKNLDQMIELHDAVEADRAAVQKSLDAERVERSKFETQLAACQAESKAAKARADDLQQRETGLRTELAQLRNATPPTTPGQSGRDD